jgi:hypothetical protein
MQGRVAEPTLPLPPDCDQILEERTTCDMRRDHMADAGLGACLENLTLCLPQTRMGFARQHLEYRVHSQSRDPL